MKKVTVSAAALRKVLNALNGPGYYIRELQVTRGPLIGGDNPINILCDEYNAAVEAHNEARKVGDGGTVSDDYEAGYQHGLRDGRSERHNANVTGLAPKKGD